MNRNLQARSSTCRRRSCPVACGLVVLLLGTSVIGAARAREPLPFTIAQECVWGELVAAEKLKDLPQSSNEALQRRLDRIGRKVARVSDRPHHLYRFLAVESPEPQAFSAPCGIIWVTDSLLAKADDDEIAFALGHEIAHTILRHHVRQVQHELDKPGASATPFLSYSHSAIRLESEMEADRFGALYAMRAGFRFTASLDLLRSLQQHIPQKNQRAARAESDRRLKSLEAFQEELELTMVRFQEGVAAIQDGNPEEAIANLRLFVVQFPYSIVGRVNLGSAFLAKLRQEAGAPSGLSEAFPTIPEAAPTLRAHLSRRDLGEAREQFERAIDIWPNPMAEAGLGLVYTRLGEYASARVHLDRALAGAPEHADISLDRGNVEFLAGEYREALLYYLDALRLRPGWPAAFRNLAMTFEEMGEHEKAREFWFNVPEEDQWISESFPDRAPENSLDWADLADSAIRPESLAWMCGPAPPPRYMR